MKSHHRAEFISNRVFKEWREYDCQFVKLFHLEEHTQWPSCSNNFVFLVWKRKNSMIFDHSFYQTLRKTVQETSWWNLRVSQEKNTIVPAIPWKSSSQEVMKLVLNLVKTEIGMWSDPTWAPKEKPCRPGEVAGSLVAWSGPADQAQATGPAYTVAATAVCCFSSSPPMKCGRTHESINGIPEATVRQRQH